MSHFICIDFNIFYVTFISVSTFVVINKQKHIPFGVKNEYN